MPINKEDVAVVGYIMLGIALIMLLMDRNFSLSVFSLLGFGIILLFYSNSKQNSKA